MTQVSVPSATQARSKQRDVERCVNTVNVSNLFRLCVQIRQEPREPSGLCL
jgi:hypothetical protein